MTRTIALLLPLLLAPSGCIIYENNSEHDLDASDWWSDDDSGNLANPGDSSDTSEEPALSGLIVTPDHAEAGETLLITITSTTELDLSVVVDASFSANVTVHELLVDNDQVQIIATVEADAAQGPASIDVELANGQILTVDVPFIVDAPAAPEDTDSCDR